MIWNYHTRPDADDSAIISHITAEIDAVCGEDVSVSSDAIKEMARAVVSFIHQTSDCSFTDSDNLLLLASRALSSMGETRTARRLLVFGTGLVRPSEWEVTGEEDMWVLDLRKMTVHNNSPLELVFFSGLKIIIESIADVWDESGGFGALGLRHVCLTALALLGGSERKKDIAALAEEIKAVSAAKLEQMRNERGWQYAPLIINLDES